MDNLKEQSLNISYRNLTPEEINILETDNYAESWNNIFVTDSFNPELIRGCTFLGIVKIGRLEKGTLDDNGIKLPVGIYKSTIMNSVIGDYNAVHNVSYISNYITGSNVFLFNIGEMHTSEYPYFGNGCINAGANENLRSWIEVWNENGMRKILPFEDMLPSDAYLYARYRNRPKLQKKLLELTDLIKCNDYGTVNDKAVVKHCKTIKNVNIGPSAYITGADILLNITIKSHENERTLIGEGVQLKDGIVNSGCKIYFGVKAIRFITGNCCTVNNGARLIDTFLGDNSTVSCCEVLNSIIFPAHEQHHNNSFLISALVQGQSNIAAGATIGSNHNSRTHDGEIIAGRGFWPGLCTSFKHNSRFASFSLIAKGAYMYELDIPFPFSLTVNSEKYLKIIPAYYFLYNMYALARNDIKFSSRDKRFFKNQKIIFDHLAPDTIDEILRSLELLEYYAGKSWFSGNSKNLPGNREILEKGKQLLTKDTSKDFDIETDDIEKSNRKVIILKADSAYSIYREIVNYYAIKTIIFYMDENKIKKITDFKDISQLTNLNWINFGGQLIRNTDADELLNDIEEGKIKSWYDIHIKYEALWKLYPHQLLEHAFNTLMKLHNFKKNIPSESQWKNCCTKAMETQDRLYRLVTESRKKDFENNFRQVTFDTREEMEAVYGLYKDDKVIKEYGNQAAEFQKMVKKFIS